MPCALLTRPPGHGLRLNPHVAALPAYNAGMDIASARRLAGREDIARLASNENPLGCSPRVLAALRSAALEPWRYADPACRALREALGRGLAVAPERIVVGNGSEELVAALARASLQPGCTVLTVVPGFGLHEIEPLACGAQVVKIAMTPQLGFDLPALQQALAARPAMCILSTPWNPVGPALDRPQLERLAAAVPHGTLLVVDEAYFEYRDASVPDSVELLRTSGCAYAVLRTFSKAYGLAGLRVGYAVCSHEALARAVASAKTPFNVNAAAQAAALAAWEDPLWMRASVQRTRDERERVRAALLEQGWRVAPSQGNFLFVELGRDSTAVADGLLRGHGVLVKAWREPGYGQFLRATIGTGDENDRLLAALAGFAAR